MSVQSTPRAVRRASRSPIRGRSGWPAFAMTTFVLSMFNADLVSRVGRGRSCFGLALAYGGIAQVLAGMWEFRTGNTFGAVAFTSFGAFWLSFWAFVQFYAASVPAADAGHAVGPVPDRLGHLHGLHVHRRRCARPAAIALVFILLAVTFFVLGIGNARGSDTLIKAAGWFGLATAIAAWYASFAAVTNSTFGRTVMPVMPLKR